MRFWRYRSLGVRAFVLAATLALLAQCGGKSGKTKPEEPGAVAIHSVAIAFPRVELMVRSGDKVKRAPSERQAEAAVELVKAFVRHMPGGARALAPLPYELGEDTLKSICHRDSYLSLARLVDESHELRSEIAQRDPLEYILQDGEGICEFPAYGEADALLVTYLHGTEDEWVGNTAGIIAAIAISAATMGRVIVIPGGPAQGLTLRSVLIDMRTRKVLSTSQEISTLSASPENLDDMIAETAECLERFNGMPTKKFRYNSGYGCRVLQPYRFVYEETNPEEDSAPATE